MAKAPERGENTHKAPAKMKATMTMKTPKGCETKLAIWVIDCSMLARMPVEPELGRV